MVPDEQEDRWEEEEGGDQEAVHEGSESGVWWKAEQRSMAEGSHRVRDEEIRVSFDKHSIHHHAGVAFVTLKSECRIWFQGRDWENVWE